MDRRRPRQRELSLPSPINHVAGSTVLQGQRTRRRGGRQLEDAPMTISTRYHRPTPLQPPPAPRPRRRQNKEGEGKATTSQLQQQQGAHRRCALREQCIWRSQTPNATAAPAAATAAPTEQRRRRKGHYKATAAAARGSSPMCTARTVHLEVPNAQRNCGTRRRHRRADRREENPYGRRLLDLSRQDQNGQQGKPALRGVSELLSSLREQAGPPGCPC